MSDYYEKLDKAKAAFLSDVVDHQMQVMFEQGVLRNIRFARKGSSAYYFDITTWPGYLCISGDMGCFVFARLTDMFEFFRGDRINPCYWAEKLKASDKSTGHRSFSFDLLKEAVTQDFSLWRFESDEQKAEAWEAIDDEWGGLLATAEGCDLKNAVSEVMGWKCPITAQRFTDFWEHDLEEYTHHFMWCCTAIQWAIQQYDAARELVSAPFAKGGA